MVWTALITGLLIDGAAFIGILVVGGFLYAGRFPLLGKKRKSPFTAEFLRAPGQTVLADVDETRDKVLFNLMAGAWLPSLLLAVIFGTAYLTGKRISAATATIFGVTAFIGLTWLGWKTFRLGQRFRQMLLGYEGEVAVGQELNQLMAHRFRVYHDFPADGFNIDHVVIGPTGVFAVETKARAKPDTGDGKKDAHLVFDGQRLCFPGWTETAPLEQAQRQANWLHQWIQRSAAESVPVVPVLALPGWFVDRKKSGAVLLSSGRDVESVYLRYNRTPGLNPQQIQRIAHQVEGRCRNITPRVYRKSEKAMARR